MLATVARGSWAAWAGARPALALDFIPADQRGKAA
jgi:hypothetical protein